MDIESLLIDKSFYETLLPMENAAHPLQVLSESFLSEEQADIPALSEIRFAQGELYYSLKDYEAAIFKWEQVTNELEPWAKKNIADAYFEKGSYKKAEEIYKAVVSDSLVLNTEVGLQLFGLYIESDKTELADKTIKKVVKLNPDNPHVTDVARSFFEKQKDWNSAVELAISEAIRTESRDWYEILKSYVEGGEAKNIDPSHFFPALHKLYSLDQKNFEQLSVAFWRSYQSGPVFISFLQGFNDLLHDLELSGDERWDSLSTLYEETFIDLISGEYKVKQLKPIIPILLKNWMRITDSGKALMASSALLAWNDNFPGAFGQRDVEAAETQLFKKNTQRNVLEDGVRLFERIDEWAEKNKLSVSQRYKWIIDELLDLHTQHVLIAGTSGSGKSAFINSLLDEEVIDHPTSTIVMFKDAEEEALCEISHSSHTVLDPHQLDEKLTSRSLVDGEPRLIDYRLPNDFLRENGLAILDTPGFSIANNRSQEVNRYLHMADALLFVLDVNDAFTNKERDIVMLIREQVPDLPIHFLLNKMDLVHNDQEAIRIVDEAWTKINPYLPNAKIFAHSAHYRGERQLADFAEFLNANLIRKNVEAERSEKLLHFVRETISSLLNKRLEKENELAEAIQWNEDLLAKMNGAIHQLSDLEKEKADSIRKSFRLRKEEIRHEILAEIPKILRKSTDIVREDSDFRRIHVELNEKMNERIQNYLQMDILTKYYHSMQEWIREADSEFISGQEYLIEMADGFNSIFKEERLKLECDFRVLDDWRRDANRMTSGVQMEPVNILLRFTPQQLLLKSAGKLFGSIANKSMLHSKYVQLIETQDYNEVAERIAERFLLQFDLFEKTIHRDVAMFFTGPKAELNAVVGETEERIAENKELLKNMQSNPESYRDPLKLFETRLRQYEWISLADKEFQVVS